MFTVSKMLQLRLLSNYYAVLKVKNRTRKWSFVSISRHLEHVITHAKSTRERDCLRHADSHFVVILLRLLKISLLLFSGLIFFFFHFQESNADLPSEYWQIQKLVKYLKVFVRFIFKILSICVQVLRPGTQFCLSIVLWPLIPALEQFQVLKIVVGLWPF